MIPKKIHYCWFGGNPIPNELKKYMKSWKKMCPDYEIILWNESNFDINCHPFVKAAYEAKAWAFVSDYARLKVVYDNGGIYLDTDIELLKNLDDLLEHIFFIGMQKGENVSESFVNTGLGYGAIKRCEIVQKMLDEYDNVVFENNNREMIACPYLNTKVIKEYGFIMTDKKQISEGIAVYPSEYFDPITPGISGIRITDNTISIHHYSATWMSPKTVLRRKLINLIGMQNIEKIRTIFK